MRKDTIINYSYYGLLFSIYVSINSITYNLLGVTQVGSPLILLCCFGVLINTGINKKSFGYTPIVLIYSLFLSYYIIGFLARLYCVDVIYRVQLKSLLMQFITSMIIIITVHQYYYYLIRNSKFTHNKLYALIIPALISCLYSIYQILSGSLTDMYGYTDRAAGVFGNPNGLGVVGSIGLSTTFYLLYLDRKNWLLKLLLIAVFSYVIFMSLSRGSILTAILIILVFIVWHFIFITKTSKKVLKINSIFIGSFILMTVYVILNFNYLVIKYLEYGQAKRVIALAQLLVEGKVDNKTTANRVYVAEFGIKQIMNRPVFGNGLGYFQYFPAELNFHHGVHNTYLLIFGDSGIIPFLILIILILYFLFKSIFTNPKYGLFPLLMIINSAIQMIGNHNFLDEKMFNIYLILGAMYFVYDEYKSKVINKCVV